MKVVAETAAKSEAADRAYEEAVRHQNSHRSLEEAAQNESSSADKELNFLRQERDGLTSQINAVNTEIAVHNKELSALDKPEDDSSVKVLQSSIAEMLNDDKRLKEEADEFATEEESLLDSCAMAKFWSEQFPKLKLWRTSGALDSLNAACNFTLSALGMSEWEIRFSVERDGSSGGKVKSFDILVQDAEGNIAPIESFSGGETQRLRLAVMMGLSDIVRAKYGITEMPLILDELSSGLSLEGAAKMMEYLRSRAASLDIPVLVVDHMTPNSGSFDEAVLVVKDGNGARVESSE